MAKYSEVDDANLNVFTEIIGNTNLDRNVYIKILANNAQKEIGKVVKANDLVKHMTNEDVIIIINEKIFDQLEEQQKLIVADDLIAGIHYNDETDRVTINKPDMNVYKGVIKKYTFPIYERLHETIISLFEQDKNKKEAGIEPADVEENEAF
jgi:hypothetical protein